jgi:hypothetical protein
MYVKKLCKKDFKGQQKIGDVIKKINKGPFSCPLSP